jgi:glycosyltransferase involved in cell wall biosynthesis
MSLIFKADFTVHIICIDEPGLWANDLRAQGITVTSLNRRPGLDFNISVQLARIFRRDQTELIHAHQYTPWFYSALSRVLFPSPKLLFEEHGRFFPERKNYKRILFNKVVIRPLTHCIVAVSEDIRQRLHCYEGLNASSTRVIYNGVTPDPSSGKAPRDTLRKSLGFSSTDFVIGTIGRFDPIKNLPLLIRGIQGTHSQIPHIRGLLVGDGPTYTDVKALVETLNLGAKVHFTGYRQDATELLRAMDLFVLPSFSEGTSMALLEAIAASTPVIVTDVGGNPEIVINNKTGWVIPSNSVSALMAAILDAWSNPQKRHLFAAAGRCRFEDHFTTHAMCADYAVLYNQILAPKRLNSSYNAH